MSGESDAADPLDAFRQFFALRRDVLVLSVAMLAFSLAFQMTDRYMARYLEVFGAGAAAVGLYATLGNLIGAVYPYPGGALSDRIGSRTALTGFAVATTLGFAVWLLAPVIVAPRFAVAVPAGPLGTVRYEAVVPLGIFLGLFLTRAWKSFGLGATFAVVKQSVSTEELATGFASTETFRRVGFLVGPLLAAGILALAADFQTGFRIILGVALAFAAVATVVQHVLYDASRDSLGDEFRGVSQVLADLRALPPTLRPLLVGDTLVRFANGMVYAFVVLVVTNVLAVSVTVGGYTLGPDAFFGVLLAVEMVVALVSMVPVARLTRRVGFKPAVGLGFVVYATFPALLVNAPADPAVVTLLFAFSGLRFAGLPAHKALIVGPAEDDAGGRVTGTYYLVRNVIVVPSGIAGAALYDLDPRLAFGAATVVGLLGSGFFLVFGRDLDV